MRKYKKPLNRSISIGCISLILSLCIGLSIVNSHALYKAQFERYNTYLTDVLNYINHQIDADDLYECMINNQKSEKYDELQELLNNLLDAGGVHYLYIITPLEAENTHTCLTVITGMTKDEIENHYDEQNFLGDVFDDFPVETVQHFMDAMNTPGKISFDKDNEATIWGFDYTGMLPLTTSDGKTFTVLAADISVYDIYRTLLRHTLGNIFLIIVIGFLGSLIFILWSRKNLTKPIESLEQSVVNFARTSHNQADPDQLIYQHPIIHTSNEVESLSDAIANMTDDIKAYAKNILEAENQITNLRHNASKLGVLAYQDSLTHVKNKAAYDKAIEALNDSIQNQRGEFAIVMIDLNSLKHINDVYGHDKGNAYIIGSCQIICMIFTHSPVFRIGGDEFVVILENTDYKFRDELIEALKASVEGYIARTECAPWERFSMAAGMAVYDPETDKDAESVFKRADQIMYKNKQRMKAEEVKEVLDEL